MLVEFSIIPLGKGESVSGLVSKAVDIIHQSGLEYRINPMGTVIEGEWDEIMALIKRCHSAIREEADRVITKIDIDDRAGYEPRIEKKIESIEEKLGHKLNV